MNSEKSPNTSGRSYRKASARLTLLCALLLSTFLSTSAGTQPKAPTELMEALKQAKEDCNVLPVARLYERYEKSLGSNKPDANVTASVAQHLAVCLPEMLASARKQECSRCKVSSLVIGFAGEADRLAALRFVQSMNSMMYFARDLGRMTDPELRAITVKYNVGQAASVLSEQAFAIRSRGVTPDEEKKYRELAAKKKGDLTSEEQALVERIEAWNASL
jgi:hypothetical protein